MDRDGVFVSYSHADRRWLDELKECLAPVVEDRRWRWLDGQPVESEPVPEAVQRDIDASRIAILLVSARFLSSDFITSFELPALLRARDSGALTVMWIPVSASSYGVTSLNEIQAAANPTRPLDMLPAARRREEWARIAQVVAQAASSNPSTGVRPLNPRVVLVYKRWASTDEELVTSLVETLTRQGCDVFLDRDLPAGVAWGKRIAKEVREADAVIPLLSEASVNSEMVAYEVHLASEAAQQRDGKPRLIPVRVRYRGALPDSLDLLNPIQQFYWESPDDFPRLCREVLEAIERPAEDCPAAPLPLGGAVPLGSELYIERAADVELREAIDRQEMLILIKGARQMGRTSLLARGLRQASQRGARVVYTDFQRFNLSQLATLESMYRCVTESFEESLETASGGSYSWRPEKPPNWNLERFLKKRVLADSGPLVWGMDEVDRLFSFPYATEFFGLIRSWHNNRTIMSGVWEQLSMVIAYATEPFLFIQDLNQSPFNVGLKIAIQDFSLEQVMLLNDLAGSPLKSRAEIEQFYDLVGGHPLLAQRGLYELRREPLKKLLERASRDDGPFGDHLRRILVVLAADNDLIPAVERVLRGTGTLSSDQYFRLLRAGIFVGDSPEKAQPRCRLYREYLERHLVHNRPVLAMARNM